MVGVFAVCIPSGVHRYKRRSERAPFRKPHKFSAQSTHYQMIRSLRSVLCRASALLLLSCYSSPFQEQLVPDVPGRGARYYALHVRLAPALLQFFSERGCDYNPAESWTAYFSRDPDSYWPSEGWQLPDFRVLRQVSDLKLFLPRAAAIGSSKARYLGNFPIITRVAPRNYKLSERDQALTEWWQQNIWAQLFHPVARTQQADAFSRKQFLRFVDPLGPLILGQGFREPVAWQQSLKKRGFSPLQRARSGPHFLNYLLMAGVDRHLRNNSRLELWKLPVLLSESPAPFQYLGELEIDLEPGQGTETSGADTSRGKADAYQAPNDLRFNYLGQARLVFRVHNYFWYWRSYLNEMLSDPKRRLPFGVKGARLQTRRESGFVPNLLRVVPQEMPERRYPYLRAEFADKRECGF